ncbi:DsrE family protein [Halorubrum halophilum]|uniref:DsrE family protein n=1 Tax=Halorubrum halophilum TaxID=413816 RepID=UPI00186B5817|nr:DsrE family protein [Halorubrum halophilum]
MFLLLTAGPDDADAALPFVAAKGALADGDDVSLVAMADAVHLLTTDTDRHAIAASGLPTVGQTLDRLRDADALTDAVALRDCCAARDIEETDLADWATMDDERAVSRLAADHDTTLSF